MYNKNNINSYNDFRRKKYEIGILELEEKMYVFLNEDRENESRLFLRV